MDWQSPFRNELFRRRFRGEAFALRAYFYQRLLTEYGGIGSDGNLLGVPIVTTPLGIDDNWEIPRSTFRLLLIR